MSYTTSTYCITHCTHQTGVFVCVKENMFFLAFLCISVLNNNTNFFCTQEEPNCFCSDYYSYGKVRL